MSEKKRSRRRKDEYTGPGEHEAEKPSKDEYSVAKWMKKNVKTKRTKFLSHNVEYFTSNKAIDALLKSKFAQGTGAIFQTREQIIDFLDVMLEHKFYHRAKKVLITLDDKRVVNKSTKKDKEERKDDKLNKKEKDEKRDTTEEAEVEGNGINGADDAGSGSDKKEKRKRKVRLDMHPEQIFVDGSEAYVWIYDPIPLHYWIYGLILLLGAIGICMFPLWPPMLRKGVYYLSIAAAGFLVFILALTVIRLIIFSIVWGLTGGKLHFWIFPNLTEDVGFFASFWPLYESKYTNNIDKKNDKRSKSKSKKKDKDSDAEDDISLCSTSLEPEKIEEIKEHDAEIDLRQRKVAAGKRETDSSGEDNNDFPQESDGKCSGSASDSESEISGKDYEIISTNEVQNVN
ncbi:translocation protein SEC62 isoform X2 [Teleopsis dalmanni]|uniref:translocation protein SEC62 isoform X2 n=1 Tax=Teleopsis dalmanni TaxID=139649 RepID=UPI0018CDBB68|nr:translocation protein SEC62 isoform X2 [Teleopsis dalmanni]